MIFNSFEFMLFLPVVWGVFWALNRCLRLQNLWVVVASYVFYGWWDWRFLVLIAFTSAWSYVVGLLELRRWEEKPSKALLITMPWNRDLVARVGATDVERFASTVEAFAKRQGCPYVNAMLENEFPAENWMDANHLNKFGAAQFTASLCARVRACMEEPVADVQGRGR